MSEDRSRVADVEFSTGAQKDEPGPEDNTPSRFPITEALIRFTNCKLTDQQPLETYADVVARALFRTGLTGDIAAFREIREAVEGPIAQQIYESRSVIQMPDDQERCPRPFAVDNIGNDCGSVA